MRDRHAGMSLSYNSPLPGKRPNSHSTIIIVHSLAGLVGFQDGAQAMEMHSAGTRQKAKVVVR